MLLNRASEMKSDRDIGTHVAILSTLINLQELKLESCAWY